MFKKLTLFTLLCVLSTPNTSHSQNNSKITVPINLGIAPTLNRINGDVTTDQTFHYGLKIQLKAILDQETLRTQGNKIPKKYRESVKKMKELRYAPFFWLPDSLYISPKIENTGIFGITFRPIALGISLLQTSSLRLYLGAGLILTYMYIYYDADAGLEKEAGSTHFLRPGIDITAEVEIKFSQQFLLSFGWTSQVYIPQKIGEFGFGADPFGHDSIWHNGQIFLMLHFRFPYSTTL